MPEQVNVLLATYNGSRFLREQLESLEAQTWPLTRVTVRDEESTDDTHFQVEKWAARKSHVVLLRGPRLGVTRNFLTLLANPDEESDYFAFCDQDDVWLPDKLERAVTAIRECPGSQPVMYCSRVEYVDEKLRHLGYSRIPRKPDFANALVENIAAGCTVVLNRVARDIISERVPHNALMHDWWCYLVVSAFGKVIYDGGPSVKYRQHANNVTGGTPSPVELFRRRIARFLKRWRNSKLLSDQAEEFQRYFGLALASRDKEILERFLTVRGNLWRRLSYNVAMDVWRQSWIDTAILRTMILIGRI